MFLFNIKSSILAYQYSDPAYTLNSYLSDIFSHTLHALQVGAGVFQRYKKAVLGHAHFQGLLRLAVLFASQLGCVLYPMNPMMVESNTP